MLPGRDDTISAIATAATGGAVGIVRISGPAAEAVLRRCFMGLPDGARTHQLYHGRVVDPRTGELLDEALGVVMRGPHSFTGEDVAELQGHGGARNLRRVFEATLAAGARAAEPGEFSLRAFFNGRLDLTRSEAIAAIVAAESDEALRVAQAQLGGALERPVSRLRQRLLDLMTLLEATLDFAAEEHVYQLPVEEVAARIEEIDELLERMLAGFASGRLALGGARVVLAGAPNVGKSSLFNRLVGLERAIVTEIAGTTRDVLEETTELRGHRVHVVDTAGLRDAGDLVERMGIERTQGQLQAADCVLWVVSAPEALAGSLEGFDPALGAVPGAARDPMLCAALERGDRVIVVLNKVDALDAQDGRAAPPGGIGGRTSAELGRRQREAVLEAARARLPEALRGLTLVSCSAHTGEGMVALERVLGERLAALQGLAASAGGDIPLVTSARHAEALREAREALARGREALEAGLPLELASADVRDAADALGRITGVIATDDVLAAIFSSFCVGK